MNPQNQPEQPSTPNVQPQYQPPTEPQLTEQPLVQPAAPSQQPDTVDEPATPGVVQSPIAALPDPIDFALQQQPAVMTPQTAQSQPYASGPGENPNRKKKLTMILGLVVGGLVLAGAIAAAVYFMFFFVSKDDYKSAASTSGTVNTKLSSISKPIVNLNEGPSSFDNMTKTFDAVEKTYGEYKNEAIKLAESRAVKNDGDIKRFHDAFNKKHSAYMAYMDKLISSKPALVAIETCIGVESPSATTMEAYSTALKPCQDGLNAVKSEQTNTHIMKMVGAYKTFLESTLEFTRLMLEMRSSGSAGSSASYANVATKYYDGAETFTKALEDVTDGLKKDADDANPTASLKSLTDKLNEKAK